MSASVIDAVTLAVVLSVLHTRRRCLYPRVGIPWWMGAAVDLSEARWRRGMCRYDGPPRVGEHGRRLATCPIVLSNDPTRPDANMNFFVEPVRPGSPSCWTALTPPT